MSNEDLALHIQNGQQDLMERLWKQNQGIIVRNACRVMAALGASAGLDVEDLIQSAYFALVAAVADYKPGEWKFVTYLHKHLQTAFAEATGYRTAKGKNDPGRCAISLDTPMGDEEDSGTLEEVIQDPKAAAALSSAEERIYVDQLREAFSVLLQGLPEDQRSVVQRRYWDGQTYEQAGQELGTGSAAVRTAEQRAIRYFRRPNVIQCLRPFYEFDCYSGSGLGAFRSAGMSVQEKYLRWQERAAGGHR